MKTEKKKGHISLKTHFFTGILVTAPLFLTAYIVVELVAFVDSAVESIIPTAYNPNTYLPYGIPGMGIVLLIFFFTLVGMLTANFIGQAFMRLGRAIISHTPVISGVYNAFKKIFETVLGQDKNAAFKQAVLVEYPRKGLWTIAFLTGPVYDGIQKQLPKQKLVSIYVPTTPNPTSGFFLYVDKSDIIVLDIPVEEALKMILSTGIVNPTDKSVTQKNRKSE